MIASHTNYVLCNMNLQTMNLVLHLYISSFTFSSFNKMPSSTVQDTGHMLVICRVTMKIRVIASCSVIWPRREFVRYCFFLVVRYWFLSEFYSPGGLASIQHRRCPSYVISELVGRTTEAKKHCLVRKYSIHLLHIFA